MSGIFDRLDADQTEAVRLRRNGAVSAGAGSGKTTVLAARYLDLLLSSGAEVSSILCLTFTRKAAAEMRSRVWKELSGHGSRRAAEQAERFAEASISTIDSFCGLVLRSSAQLYGYPPDFRVDDPAARELAEAEALRFLLARREGGALGQLFAMLGFETVWRELFADAGHRFASPAPRPEDELRTVPTRARQALLSLARESLAAVELARGEALSVTASSSKSGALALAAFASLPANLAEGLGAGEEAPGLEELAARIGRAGELTSPFLAIRLGFGRSDDELRLKAATTAAKEAAERLAGLRQAVAQRGLEDQMIEELALFSDRLLEKKRNAGIMSFRDVMETAVHLLSTHREIRDWWKKRYRYIMVDEFQDDDELQKELLYLIAEGEEGSGKGVPLASELVPDKLFFVGDDKQSIYRFRGAEVAVFNRLGRELEPTLREGQLPPPPIPRLRTNYRSEPGLIDFFNLIFSRVLAGPTARDFEARFEPALARDPRPGATAAVGLLWKPATAAASGSDWRSDDESLAEGIALHLKGLVEGEGTLVPAADGGLRRLEWDDIAILFRSSSRQYLMERFLRLHDIPYSAAAVRSLFVESPANDLHAALRLALSAADRHAWASFLRSAFVRLTDEAFVLVLASERGSQDDFADLDLSTADRKRLEAGQRLLGELRERADRQALAGLVEWLWMEQGLRLEILGDPVAHAFLEHFDYLFALAAAADRRGEDLTRFLDRLGPLLGTPEKLEEDFEVPREAAHGIRIMTVHRSKGLEFPVVVIPWIEGVGRKDGKGGAWYRSEEVGLSLNLRPWDDPKAEKSNIFYEAAKEREAAEALAESKRLFYVACTRASSRLLFAGVERSGESPPDSFHAFLGGERRLGLMPAILPPMMTIEEVPALSEAGYARMAGGRRGVSPEGYREALPLDRGYPPRVVTATAISSIASKEVTGAAAPRSLPASPADAVVDRVPETLFGELCHAVLEARLAGLPFSTEQQTARRIPAELLPTLVGEAERFAEGFLASATGALLAGATEVRTERALLLSLGSLVVRCRLDLVIEAPGEIVIVDWKSGKEARPAEYEVQMALYRRAIASIRPGTRVRSLIFWLRSSEAEELSAEFEPVRLEAWAMAACGEADPTAEATPDEGTLRRADDCVYWDEAT